MIYCHNCRHSFEESEGLLDDYSGAHQCPYCGETDDLEEMAECAYCGKPFLAERNSGGLCSICGEVAREWFDVLWKKLPKPMKAYVLATDYHPADGGAK